MNNTKGRLEVICGSMFSGKTEELMRRLGRAEYAKQNVLTIKHSIDNRKSAATILSHNGQERLAFSIDNNKENIAKILELANKNIQVIGIDEIQFFPIEIIDVIVKLIDIGKTVIVAGLDLDFKGEPFGITPLIMAIADSVLKLKAICVVCGKDSHHTQRIVNGVPAKYDDPIILVGAKECYEARCRNCFAIDKKAQLITPAKKYTEQNI
ncbi:MAG: Thymidine kinase [candidate division TM6 bacterium GW2011_GWF2_28_16]|jgi:thymidine kinase|nr:MAG: Thymidine kinase [candidate division TM6 bacterium GW2011_GWF2_28_16]